MNRYKLVCNLDFGDMFLNVLFWIVILILTLGLAAPFFLYDFCKTVINSVEVHQIGDGGS